MHSSVSVGHAGDPTNGLMRQTWWKMRQNKQVRACLLFHQSQTSLHLHPLSGLLLTLSGISLCFFPALKKFFHFPLMFGITVPVPHLHVSSGQLSLTPIKSSTKLFPVINSALQPLFLNPNHYLFSNRDTVYYTRSRAPVI